MKNMEIVRPYRFDKPLFFTALALLTLGLIMIFSSSGVLAGEKYGQPFYFFIQQIAGAATGLALMLIILSMKKPFYQSPYFIIGLLLFTFGLLLLCFSMPPHAHTNRWVEFYGFRFQPSELAKISLVLFLALYIERRKEKLQEVPTLLIPFGVILLFVLLILKEPDFGTALFVFFLCGLLLFMGGIKPKYFVYLGILFIGIFALYMLKADYPIERFTAFFYPGQDPQGMNFQMIQSKRAIGSGGVLGVSIGLSVQKLYFLPCAHTDFIFSILGEELGLFGTLTTLLLFGIFLWRGLRISFRAPNLFSQIAAAGLTFVICTQALLNISVALGLGPSKGIPLPLLSYGRSSLVCNLIAIGILLHISQRKNIHQVIS
ncbi:MAG: FtsW/RodA/SpoVE family cell cycle protein [Candidatus Aminicenantales bacterium]